MKVNGPEMDRYKVVVSKLILGLVCVAVSFVIYNQTVRPTQMTASSPNNDIAANFTLNDLQGNIHALKDYTGTGVVVNFWATYCPPCEREMPAIESAYQDYRQQGVNVLAVNVEEPMRIVNPFVLQQDITFPVLLDRHGEVFADYGGLNLPITFFINGKGEIVESVSGEMTERMIRANMEKIKRVSNR